MPFFENNPETNNNFRSLAAGRGEALPRMSFHQRIARSEEKKRILLHFLSDEIWTTAGHAGLLLHCTRQAASATLYALERERLLVKTNFLRPGRANKPQVNSTAFGITAKGMEAIGADGRPFAGVHAHVWHHLLAQRVHIFSRLAGAKFTSERRLVIRDGGRRREQGKVPDGLLQYMGEDLAVEVQLSRKSRTDLRTIVLNHLRKIGAGAYHAVHYLFDDSRLCETFRLTISEILEEIVIEELAQIPWEGHFCVADEVEEYGRHFSFCDLHAWGRSLMDGCLLEDVPLLDSAGGGFC